MCNDGIVVPEELCFDSAAQVVVGEVIYSAHLGQFGGTADLDLIYLDSDEVIIHAGDGTGMFGGPMSALMILGQGMEVASFDGDGNLDIAVLGVMGQPTVSSYSGDGAFGFTFVDSYLMGITATTSSLADLDGNGTLDLVIGAELDEALAPLLGDGGGTFAPGTLIDIMRPVRGVGIGIFGGMVNPAVAYAVGGPGAPVEVRFGNGFGGFGGPLPTPAVANGGNDIVVADFDSDGIDDIAYVAAVNDDLSVMLGNNIGGLDPETDYTSADMPRAVTTADVDSDGILDLIVGHGGGISTAVYIYVGNGDGTFAMPTVLLQPGAVSDLTMGDANGDTVPDIVVTSAIGQIVSVLLSTP